MPVRLHLITPERALPVREADHVTFTAADGQMGIRPGHEPTVALMGIGFIELKKAGEPDVLLAVRGGVSQVYKDDIRILADQAMDVQHIDEAQVQNRLAQLGENPSTDPAQARRDEDEAKWLLTQLALTGRRQQTR